MKFDPMDNTDYMKICLDLAESALASGNPPVGAILVANDEIIGEGIESGRTTDDITNHAEILAIKDSISKGRKSLLSDSIMYTTHEPCIMCSYVIRHHHISKIVFGMGVDFIGGYTSGFQILLTEDVPDWGSKPEIQRGVCEKECRDLSLRYQKTMK